LNTLALASVQILVGTRDRELVGRSGTTTKLKRRSIKTVKIEASDEGKRGVVEIYAAARPEEATKRFAVFIDRLPL